jgi:RND family efflux transporter MFP subunit
VWIRTRFRRCGNNAAENAGKRFCAALVLATTLLAGCGSSSHAQHDDDLNAPPAAVVKVTRKDLSNELQIASEFQPYQDVNVFAKVSGYIRKLYVDWGAHVHTGQLLAELEIPELQQQLELDQAAVRRSEHDLARSREELNQASSRFTVTDLTYQRLETVMKTRPGLVAQEDVDVANGKNQEAKAGVSAAQASQAAAEQALAVAKAGLEKDRAMYAYSRITAPFDGVVTEITAYTGALLPAGASSNKNDQALLHLSQINMLRLVIPLPERAVGDIHVGDKVAVQVANNKQELSGKIASFSGQIDTQTRTMHTEVHVPNPKYELVPGMYATVQIPLHAVKNVLTVPPQAVQASGENHGSVLVVNGSSKIERRDVVLGLQTANATEILSGLQESEMVIFGEQSQYKAGQVVRPRVVTPAEAE